MDRIHLSEASAATAGGVAGIALRFADGRGRWPSTWLKRLAGICLLGVAVGCAAGAKTAGSEPYDRSTREQAVALYNAIIENDYETAAHHIENGLAPEARYLKGVSALELAVDKGRPAIVELLIQRGGDPDFKTKNDVPLLVAALVDVYQRNESLKKHILENKIDVPVPESREVARVLLEHGADPNVGFPLKGGAGKAGSFFCC